MFWIVLHFCLTTLTLFQVWLCVLEGKDGTKIMMSVPLAKICQQNTSFEFALKMQTSSEVEPLFMGTMWASVRHHTKFLILHWTFKMYELKFAIVLPSMSTGWNEKIKKRVITWSSYRCTLEFTKKLGINIIHTQMYFYWNLCKLMN